MNNKGFTIIELIATVVILTVVLSIGAYAIIRIVNESNERNYQTLLKSVKSAVESYAIECQYNDNTDSVINCDDNQVTIGELVTYGFLTGNDKDTNKKYTIVNPKTNESIATCKVKYTNNNGKITITAVSPTGSCPTTY